MYASVFFLIIQLQNSKSSLYLHSRLKRQTLFIIGRLAQLVQSTCLTSRGSGVRTPHLPQNLGSESFLFFA